MSSWAAALAERALSSLLEPDSAGGELAHDKKSNAGIKLTKHNFFVVILILLRYLKALSISRWARLLLSLALSILLVSLVTQANREKEKIPIKNTAIIFFIHTSL
jgi:hypothetical protein